MPRKMPRPGRGLLFDAAAPTVDAPDAHLAQSAPDVDRIHDESLHGALVQNLHIEHDAVECVVLVIFRLDSVGVVDEVVGVLLEEEGGHGCREKHCGCREKR